MNKIHYGMIVSGGRNVPHEAYAPSGMAKEIADETMTHYDGSRQRSGNGLRWSSSTPVRAIRSHKRQAHKNDRRAAKAHIAEFLSVGEPTPIPVSDPVVIDPYEADYWASYMAYHNTDQEV